MCFLSICLSLILLSGFLKKISALKQNKLNGSITDRDTHQSGADTEFLQGEG